MQLVHDQAAVQAAACGRRLQAVQGGEVANIFGGSDRPHAVLYYVAGGRFVVQRWIRCTDATGGMPSNPPTVGFVTEDEFIELCAEFGIVARKPFLVESDDTPEELRPIFAKEMAAWTTDEIAVVDGLLGVRRPQSAPVQLVVELDEFHDWSDIGTPFEACKSVRVFYHRDGRLSAETSWVVESPSGARLRGGNPPVETYMSEAAINRLYRKSGVERRLPLIPVPEGASSELITALGNFAGGRGPFGLFQRRTPEQVQLVTDYVFSSSFRRRAE